MTKIKRPKRTKRPPIKTAKPKRPKPARRVPVTFIDWAKSAEGRADGERLVETVVAWAERNTREAEELRDMWRRVP